MKKFFLAALLLAGGSLSAQSWPSPQLILPHFVVDLESLETTLYAVTNVGSAPTLVRTSVFGNGGQLVGTFTKEVAVNATSTFNLRDLFWDAPQICAISTPINATALLVGGRAEGYVVIDAVTACTGTELDTLNTEARLVGDAFDVDTTNAYAEGYTLLAALTPGKHYVRFGIGGPFDSTTLDVVAPGSTSIGVQVFAEDGSEVTPGVNFAGGFRPGASARVDVHQDLSPPIPYGTLVLDCGFTPCAVATTFRAAGQFSARVPGTPLGAVPYCPAPSI